MLTLLLQVRKIPTPLDPQPRHLILGGEEEEEEEEEMRTWLRMELEEGGITKPSSDLDTSNGLPSSNGTSRSYCGTCLDAVYRP